jgi:hypothetical protein
MTTAERQAEEIALATAYRMAHRAATDHVRSDGCTGCNAANLCTVGQQLFERSDELQAQLSWDTLTTVAPSSQDDLDEDDERCLGLTAVIVAALAGGLLLWLPLYLMLWPWVRQFVGRLW